MSTNTVHKTNGRSRTRTGKTSQRSGRARAHLNGTHIRDEMEMVRRDMTRLANKAGKTAMGWITPVEEYIREKPVKSALIAAGVGAVVGWVFWRR